MTNDTEQAVTIEPKVNVALTNVNGIADYSMEVKEHDKTLKLPITDVVKAPNEITVPAKGQIELPIEVKMPEEEFDGILLGGISLQEKRRKIISHNKKERIDRKSLFVCCWISVE